MDEEIERLKLEVQKKNQEDSNMGKEIIPSSVRDEIDAQYSKNKNDIINSEQFKQLSKEITDRAAKAEFSKDMLKILTQEQKNKLAEHLYECEVEKFNYRKK